MFNGENSRDNSDHTGFYCGPLNEFHATLLTDSLKIVTSRLGRSYRSYSRAESMVSEAFSATSDEIETIQWKRGNVLGKGAYGTVGIYRWTCPSPSHGEPLCVCLMIYDRHLFECN